MDLRSNAGACLPPFFTVCPHTSFLPNLLLEKGCSFFELCEFCYPFPPFFHPLFILLLYTPWRSSLLIFSHCLCFFFLKSASRFLLGRCIGGRGVSHFFFFQLLWFAQQDAAPFFFGLFFPPQHQRSGTLVENTLLFPSPNDSGVESDFVLDSAIC